MVFVSVITWIAGAFLIIFVLYIMSRKNLWFKKYGFAAFIILFLLGFTLFFIGYFFGYDTDVSVFQALSSLLLSLFASARIMFTELDMAELGWFSEQYWFRLIYACVILSANIMLAATVISNIGGNIISKLRMFFLRILGTKHDLYLVYGLNDDSIFLIEDIRMKNPESVIFILTFTDDDISEAQRELENKAFQSGAYKVEYQTKKDFYRIRSLIKKCRGLTYALFISHERWKNVSIAKGFCSEYSPKEFPELHFYLSYDKEKSTEISNDKIFLPWDIHWLSPEELAVRQLIISSEFLKIFPKEKCVDGRIDGKIELIIIGYSQIAQELCRYLSFCLQTAGLSINIRLIAKNIKDEFSFFKCSNPEIGKVVSFIPMECEPDSEQFYEYFSKEYKQFSGVFFAGDYSENRLLAFRLKEILPFESRELPFYILTKNMEEDDYALKNLNISVFGCTEQIYNCEILIDEKLDAMAKAVHGYYNNVFDSRKDIESLWKQTSLYNKDSSRALAAHIPWKARCAGFYITDSYESYGVFSEKINSSAALLKNLSLGEHLRWEAVLFAIGWRSVSPEKLMPNKDKDNEKRLHACLIPWEELDNLYYYYQKDFKAIDIYLIQSLEKILSNAQLFLTEDEKKEII